MENLKKLRFGDDDQSFVYSGKLRQNIWNKVKET